MRRRRHRRSFEKKLELFFIFAGETLRMNTEKLIFYLQSGIDQKRKVRLKIALGLSVIFFGSFLVTGISRGEISIPGFFGPLGLETLLKGRVTGLDSDDQGNLLLSGFESEEDLAYWDKTNASMELSSQYASEGQRSAQVLFEGGQSSSGIAIEQFFTRKSQASNWLDFESLRFNVFNPNPEEERLLIQIKDEWNRKYKSDFYLKPGEEKDIVIPTRTIGASINIRKIDQLNLFRWNPRGTKEFYFDNIRLVRPAAQKKIVSPNAPFRLLEHREKRKVNPVDYQFKEKRQAWVSSDNETVRIPFIVANENSAPCAPCPVEGSIPFPMKEVKSPENIRIKNSLNQEIPFQFRELGKWPDGSVKWIAPHFLLSLAPGETAGFFLEYGAGVKAMPAPVSIQIRESDKEIIIHTGKLEAVLNKKKFFLFERVSMDLNSSGGVEADEAVVTQAPLYLEFNGKNFQADLAQNQYEIKIEEKGPLRTVVKASGWFQSEKGERFGQVIVRYYFYQGESAVKVSHTWIYTGFPANPYYDGYRNLDLPQNEMISALGIRIPYETSDPGKTKMIMGAQYPEALEVSGGDQTRMIQLGYRLARIETPMKQVLQSEFYSGWADISDARAGITVSIRNFRENFPKALGYDQKKGEIQVDLWPSEAGPLDLSTTKEAVGPGGGARGSAFGTGKTHEILFYFHSGDGIKAQAMEKAYGFSERLMLRNNPYWVEATGALGRLFPRDERYATEEKVLEKLFDWAYRQPKIYAWYGMMNFGDTLTWYRGRDSYKMYPEPGWNPMGPYGWFNNEGVGIHTGAFLQFARSGLLKYFEFGENAARHIMDVDTIHYNAAAQDGRLKKILKEKLSSVGAMHRQGANHWSGPAEDASYTNVWGLLLYYYLSGEERAYDVVKEVGEYFLTEPYASLEKPHENSLRAMVNALWGDVLLFEATGDKRYKAAADRLIELLLKGQFEDGSFRKFFNPSTRIWSGGKSRPQMEKYVLGSLIVYHTLTQDREVKGMILRLVKYLASDEIRSANILHGFAYAYWLTHHPAYLEAGGKALKWLGQNQTASRESLLDGMIYDQPRYDQPMIFLSTAPYMFAALEDGFERGQQAAP